MIPTMVIPAALYAGVTDVVSNAATTASVVAGGAPAIVAPPPAGADEASALATMNTTAHSANFLATAASSVMEMGRHAAQLGATGLMYEAIDAANAAAIL
jgi:hypothetical protein